MFSDSENIAEKELVKYFGPAKVLDKSKDGKSLLLGIEREGEKIQTWSRIAVPFLSSLSFGDSVLAAGENINQLYVIGVLETSSLSFDNRLISSNGSNASIKKNDSNEKILVHTNRGELLFEYDTLSGRSRVNMQSGDLEFFSGGNINFVSEGKINLKSNQLIQIESSSGIHISVRHLMEKMVSSISLDKIKMNLSSSNLNIVSGRADLRLGTTKIVGNSFSAVLKNSKLIVGKLETIANDIITKSKNIFKTVEQLTQQKTGRLRILVNSTLHIKSKNSYQFSEEDFKVNAEKIHLG